MLGFRKNIVLGVLMICASMMMQASHIIGGSIHYESIGNDQYVVSLTLYRDCSSNTQYDDPVSIGCFDPNGLLVENLEIPLSQAIVTDVPTESNSACYMAPLGLCVQEAIYSDTVTLPLIPGGYTLAYQRCCRNFSIINVPTGTSVGITLTTQIPGSELVAINSNPDFATHPPLIICMNAPFVFDQQGTDSDGDVLVYELCTPLNTNVNGSYINPPGAPPYYGLTYNAGYSADYPIDATPVFAVDANTGVISCTPTALGQFVVGVCIHEYRDGVLIASTNRDFQLNVTNCEPTSSPAIADQIDICGGLSVDFINNSIEELTYHWDFGDTTLTSDTSNVFEPSYTYASLGTYNVTLILNPGLPCADTTYSTYISTPSIEAEIVGYSYSCEFDQLQYDFDGEGATNSSAVYDWTFGPLSVPSSGNIEDPQNVFLGPGSASVLVTLELSQEGCVKTDTITVNIPAEVVSMIQPQSTFCDGFSYQFTNLSQNATSYQWDFGVAGNSDMTGVINPSFTYADTGYYEVRLVAMAANVCPDTSTTGMLIYGLLNPSFDDPADQCFEGNTFQFLADGASTNQAVYQWDFGGNAFPQTSTSINPTNVHFNNTGTHQITLTITENDCVETVSNEVAIFLDPVFSAIVDTLSSCENINAIFYGTSTYDFAVNYQWSFGDGFSSSAASPTHQYTTPGVYDVTVVMSTDEGCIASDSIQFNNVITLSPPPIAGFTFSNNQLDLLNPNTEIISTAVNSVSCSYFISDGGSADACDFSYTFSESGIITITQQVISAEGCVAEIAGTIIINGFAFYAPNSFSPNEDEVNDVWLPSVIGSTKYSLSIFNRWGDKIFETNDYKVPWTGEVHGGEFYAQDGVYNYLVKVDDLLSIPHEFSGHIVLIR